MEKDSLYYKLITKHKNTKIWNKKVNETKKGISMTYNQLNLRVNKIFKYFSNLEFQEKDIFLFISNNNIYYIIILLTAILNKNIITGISPDIILKKQYDIIKYYINYTKCKILFISKYLKKNISEFLINNNNFKYLEKIIIIDDFIEGCDDFIIYNNKKLINNIFENNTFGLFFTSGTTGKPKGCIHTHKNIISALKIYNKTYLYNTDCYVLSTTTWLGAYGMLHGVLGPLYNGMIIVTDNMKEKISNYNIFYDKIYIPLIKNDVTKQNDLSNIIIVSTPELINKIIKKDIDDNLDLKKVFYILTAGDILQPYLHELWNKIYGVPLINNYGCSETVASVISNKLPNIFIERYNGNNIDTKYQFNIFEGGIVKGSIGYSTSDVKIRIVNDDDNNCSDREIGELYILVDSKCDGYLGNKKKNTNLWLASGDLAEYYYDNANKKRYILHGRKPKYEKISVIHNFGILRDIMYKKTIEVIIENIIFEILDIKDVLVIFNNDCINIKVIDKKKNKIDITQLLLEEFKKRNIYDKSKYKDTLYQRYGKYIHENKIIYENVVKINYNLRGKKIRNI